MSGPKHSRSRRGRVYVWPPDEPYELEVPSSTTIIGDGLPKPALKWWAAKVVAQYAVEHVDAWKFLPTEDAVDLLKRAHTRYTSSRADRGTATHAAIESYLEGREPDLEPGTETYALYEGARKFLDDHQPEILHVNGAGPAVETTLYNRTHQYAGTCDLLANIWGQCGPVDWKTSKSIYPDVALQLASYAHAEFIGTDDGQEVPVPDMGDLGVAVRLYSVPVQDDNGEVVGYEGHYQAVPLNVGERTFRAFLKVQGVFEWARVTSKRVILDLDMVLAQAKAAEAS